MRGICWDLVWSGVGTCSRRAGTQGGEVRHEVGVAGVCLMVASESWDHQPGRDPYWIEDGQSPFNTADPILLAIGAEKWIRCYVVVVLDVIVVDVVRGWRWWWWWWWWRWCWWWRVRWWRWRWCWWWWKWCWYRRQWWWRWCWWWWYEDYKDHAHDKKCLLRIFLFQPIFILLSCTLTCKFTLGEFQ